MEGIAAPVAIALGSNLGDRRAHLDWAIEQLAAMLSDLRASALLETEPHDVPEAQPPYLNAVVVGATTLAPHALLDALLDLERRCGRRRPSPKAPRTLDLDLILFDSRTIDDRDLVVPHPRFRERRFVLEPLAALRPDWVDPGTGRTVAELLAGLGQDRGRRPNT